MLDLYTTSKDIADIGIILYIQHSDFNLCAEYVYYSLLVPLMLGLR